MLHEGLTQKKHRKNTVYFVDADNIIKAKICTKCNETKALDDFVKGKTGLGGRLATCKDCHSELARKRLASTRRPDTRACKHVKLEERNSVTGKKCTKCNEWVSLDGYPKHKSGLGGRASTCKVCRLAYSDANKERTLELASKWQRDNPDKVMVIQQRRRARKKCLADDFTDKQMQDTLRHFSGCVLTGDNTDIHWDHVIPLATGYGGTTHGNMIPLREDLNMSKHDANIFEWFNVNKERFNLSQAKFDILIEWLAKVNEMTVEEYRSYVYWCFENKRNIDASELGSHSA